MLRTPLLLVLLMLLGALPPSAGLAQSPAAKPAAKALYLGIDGTRFDALRAAKTPNFDKLLEEGIYADNCPVLGPRYRKNDTISGPGWSTILTGVWADKHGVHDNSFEGKNYGEYPHFFARLKQQFPAAQTASLVTWKPIDDHIVSGADHRRNFDDESREYARFDRQAAAEAVERLADPQLDCLFLYIASVDETGHRHGFHPTVPEYLAAIEEADRLVGQVIEAVKARPGFDRENWLIVATSDHGGQGKGHSKGHDVPEILNSFLIVSGKPAQRGRFEQQTYLCDAPVTVLAHLGVELEPAWALDGRPVGLKPAE